jgi:hypothetical protein
MKLVFRDENAGATVVQSIAATVSYSGQSDSRRRQPPTATRAARLLAASSNSQPG